MNAVRAPVRPRIVAPHSGEALLLEDEVRALLDERRYGVLQLAGAAGLGKTTALAHLSAIFRDRADLRLLDDALFQDARFEHSARAGKAALVVYTTRCADRSPVLARRRLAGWADDDLIEYLLAAHKDRCAEVLARVTEGDRQLFGNSPEIWRIALDELAAEPSLPDAAGAVCRYFDARVSAGTDRERIEDLCLEAATGHDDRAPVSALREAELPESVMRLLRHGPVRLLLASRRIAADLSRGAECPYLANDRVRGLIERTAALIKADSRAIEWLERLFAQERSKQPRAASLLHAACPGWTPQGKRLKLVGAFLSECSWPGTELQAADLRGTDFNRADLRRTLLDHSAARNACFARARLAGASLGGIDASKAAFSGADLTDARADGAKFRQANFENACLDGASLRGASFVGAKLGGATFRKARLRRANLGRAEIDGADFTEADLREARLYGLVLRVACFAGTRFARAELRGCDLEGMDLRGADFEEANLMDAYLTGAYLAGANFRAACLRRTGLADADFEGAVLRDADLRGATFHMGSSRSGLIFSPIACEGSRTGFYTEDLAEQTFRSPEEIRKANLCGADLRGARIDNVDFYLVDMRGALYDAAQESHFRRCGAILEDCRAT